MVEQRKSWKDYKIQIGEAIIPQVSFSPLKSNRPLSRPLSEYRGKYASKCYGEVEIFREGQNLMIKFPAFKMYLEHHEYDTFINRVTEVHHQNAPSFYINFYPGSDGSIDELTIGFSEEPERFSKF